MRDVFIYSNGFCQVSLPIQIRLFSFDINRVDGVQSKPCRKSKSAFIRPLRKWWQHYRLMNEKRLINHLASFQIINKKNKKAPLTMKINVKTC